jgi:hypothetical protein
MAFNANDKPVTKGFDQELLEEGLYPARLARIIELGEQEDKYGVKPKVIFAFTIPTEHITIEGVKKQRMMMTWALNQTSNPDGTLMKYMKALQGATWDDVLGKPCMIEVSHDKKGDKTYMNITGVVKPMAGMSIEMPDCESYVFDFSKPDKKVFESMSDYRQGQIKDATNYEGSQVQAMVEGKPVAADNNQTSDDSDDSPI